MVHVLGMSSPHAVLIMQLRPILPITIDTTIHNTGAIAYILLDFEC